MSTTYTVTNSFSADTTAIASEVNQDFTDVLTALNSYDASNLASGTVPLARISGLTTTQIAAATLVIESEGIESNDNDTTIPTSAAVKDAYDTAIAAVIVTLSAYTNLDSNNNAMLKAHAYKAITAGQVTAYADVEYGSGKDIKGYVGSTTDPVGAGTLIQREENDGVSYNNYKSISMLVAKDEYFEITVNGTPTILWKSFGTLSKPVDNN